MFEKLKFHMLKREVKKQNRNVAFVSWRNVKSVLLLFDVDNDIDYNAVIPFVEKLRKEGRTVRSFCFVNQRQTAVASKKDDDVFCRKEVGFLGKPTQELLKNNDEFDIVIDLTLTDILPLMYKMVNTKARLRCGLNKHSAFNLLDFMIELSGNEDKTVRQCKLGREIVSYLYSIEGV